VDLKAAVKIASGLPLRAFFSLPMVGLFVLFGVLLSLISFYNANQAAITYAQQLAGHSANLVHTQLEQLLGAPRRAIEANKQALSADLISLDDAGSLSAFFYWQMQQHPRLTYLSVADVNGRYLGIQRHPKLGQLSLLSSWDNTDLLRSQYELDHSGHRQARLKPAEPYDAKERRWFKQAVEQGKTSWYPVYDYRAFDGQGIGVSSPWYSADGQLKAVLTADISLDILQYFLNALAHSISADLLILDDEQRVLSSNLPGEVQQLVLSRLQQLPVGKDDYQALDLPHHHYQLVRKSFSDSAGLKLTILVLIDNGALMTQAYQTQRQSGLLMAAAVLIFALLGWLLSRQLTQPVMALKTWAQHLQQGQASALVVPESAISEINVLSQALSQMAFRLDQSYLQLAQRIEVDTVSLQRLSLAVNRTSNGVLVLDNSGAIEWVNQALERMANQTMPQLLGRNLVELLNELAPGNKLAALAQALRQQQGFTLDLYGQIGQGRTRWYSLECDAVVSEQGELTGFVLLCQDIQGRKEAESAEQSSRARTERQRSALTQLVLNEAVALGDSLAFAQVLAKVTSAALDCNRVSVWMMSEQGDEMFCLALYQQDGPAHQGQMVLRRNDFPVYFSTISEQGWIRAEDALQDPLTSEFASVYLQPLGISSLLDAGILLAGRVVGVVCLEHCGPQRHWHSDEEAFISAAAAVMAQTLTVAQRKDAEQISREYAQHTQTVLNNVVDGIITIDDSGRIASVNPAAQQLFGCPAEALNGRFAIELLSVKYQQQQNKSGYFPMPGQTPVLGQNREVEGLNAAGENFAMEMALSQIRRQGRLVYICTLRDISDRKRVERLKSEFVSTVSHELRTPLTSIAGALGLLEHGVAGELPVKAKELVSLAHKNSKRLTTLINDLLDIEKIAAGKMQFECQPQAVLPLVRQAMELNRVMAQEKRIDLQLEVQQDEVQASLDAKRFIQVLSNFLSNAIKFSPAGSVVQIAMLQVEHQVRIAVIDHGPGIAAEFHQRLFKRFSQADSSDTRHISGTGLGLAISKELVEGMGGQIGFHSAQGEGATFYCCFPLSGRTTA